MITRDELQAYARLRNLNLGQAEIDYLLMISLFLLSKNNSLVFKGGTALAKAYNLDRFSNDLDFNIINNINTDELCSQLKEEIKEFGIIIDIKKEEGISSSKRHILRIDGPLYNGNLNSKCSVVLDFSFREKAIFPAELKKINHQLNEIPVFEINVMDIREIFTEKIRAIMTRNKARDLYDAYYLLNKNVPLSLELINEKLKYYGEKFSFKNFNDKINEKKKIWDNELKLLVKNAPEFSLVKKSLIAFIKNMT